MGDYFFVEHKGAEMPVWVRGNEESGVVLIWIHGGPGGSALNTVSREPYFVNVLEPQMAVAYYDQRASGNAQGKVDKSTLTIEQFVEDLNVVVEVIKKKYNHPKIFLAGHSWGGIIATKYLLNKEYQEKITGWIEIDGLHNLVDVWQYRHNYVDERASMLKNQGEKEEYWSKALQWLKENPTIQSQDQKDVIYKYMIEAGGRDTYRKQNGYTEKQLDGQYDIPNNNSLINKNRKVAGNAFNDALFNLNLSPQMGTITVPSLFIWGAKDGVLPKEMAYDAHRAVGTPASEKEVVVMEHSGHYPQKDQPDIFVYTVLDFIEKYK